VTLSIAYAEISLDSELIAYNRRPVVMAESIPNLDARQGLARDDLCVRHAGRAGDCQRPLHRWQWKSWFALAVCSHRVNEPVLVLTKMKAFILVAGAGTRLKSITDHAPKCLVPIQGVPLLAIWLQICRDAGIHQVLINPSTFTRTLTR